MDGKKLGLYFYALKNILTILSSPSSSFSSRRLNMTIYFSLKVDLYCHVGTTRRKTRQDCQYIFLQCLKVLTAYFGPISKKKLAILSFSLISAKLQVKKIVNK
jgi:hypothetical protein